MKARPNEYHVEELVKKTIVREIDPWMIVLQYASTTVQCLKETKPKTASEAHKLCASIDHHPAINVESISAPKESSSF